MSEEVKGKLSFSLMEPFLTYDESMRNLKDSSPRVTKLMKEFIESVLDDTIRIRCDEYYPEESLWVTITQPCPKDSFDFDGRGCEDMTDFLTLLSDRIFSFLGCRALPQASIDVSIPLNEIFAMRRYMKNYIRSKDKNLVELAFNLTTCLPEYAIHTVDFIENCLQNPKLIDAVPSQALEKLIVISTHYNKIIMEGMGRSGFKEERRKIENCMINISHTWLRESQVIDILNHVAPYWTMPGISIGGDIIHLLLRRKSKENVLRSAPVYTREKIPLTNVHVDSDYTPPVWYGDFKDYKFPCKMTDGKIADFYLNQAFTYYDNGKPESEAKRTDPNCCHARFFDSFDPPSMFAKEDEYREVLHSNTIKVYVANPKETENVARAIHKMMSEEKKYPVQIEYNGRESKWRLFIPSIKDGHEDIGDYVQKYMKFYEIEVHSCDDDTEVCREISPLDRCRVSLDGKVPKFRCDPSFICCLLADRIESFNLYSESSNYFKIITESMYNGYKIPALLAKSPSFISAFKTPWIEKRSYHFHGYIETVYNRKEEDDII